MQIKRVKPKLSISRFANNIKDAKTNQNLILL